MPAVAIFRNLFCHFFHISEGFRVKVLFGTVLPQTIIGLSSSETGHTWSSCMLVLKSSIPNPPLFPDRLEEQARNRSIPYCSFVLTIPRFALLPELPPFHGRFRWLAKRFLYPCKVTQFSRRGTASPCPRPGADHASRLSEYRTQMHPLPYRVVRGLARMELTISLCSLQQAGWGGQMVGREYCWDSRPALARGIFCAM